MTVRAVDTVSFLHEAIYKVYPPNDGVPSIVTVNGQSHKVITLSRPDYERVWASLQTHDRTMEFIPEIAALGYASFIWCDCVFMWSNLAPDWSADEINEWNDLMQKRKGKGK